MIAVTKFYVKSGKCKRIVLAETTLAAAIACFILWQSLKRRLGISVKVSEVGFEGDHPHHEKDDIIAMSYIRTKIKKKSD